MRNSEKKLSFSSPVGYSFMLTIIIILTLVIFAVLSLSASLRDYDYSRRVAEKTTAYYEANTRAYDILSRIDEIFAGAGSLEEGLAGMAELPEVTVLGEAEISGEEGLKDCSGAVSYEVEVKENQKLEVLLGVTEGKNGKACYRIVKWKEASSGSWEGGTTLPVIGSE